MSELVLLRPWWLLAIPLLLTAILLIRRRGADAGGWEGIIKAEMLAGLRALNHMESNTGQERRHWSLTAAALLVLGLSGPALPRKDAPVLAQTDAIVIAIDMSPSVTHGRALADAQAAAARILTHTGGRPIGLILYTDTAYEVAAPTSDSATLESQIAVLSRETMPDQGSRPASALGMAADMLSGLKRADLIVISDGGGIDEAALAEAGRLKANGVRISALIVKRTAPGAPPPDETALRRIANGAVAPSHSPEAVLAGLTTHGAYTKDNALNVVQFVDYGPYLAGLALLAYLMLFRRQA